jgi:methyl coenzyme M reductase subunit C
MSTRVEWLDANRDRRKKIGITLACREDTIYSQRLVTNATVRIPVIPISRSGGIRSLIPKEAEQVRRLMTLDGDWSL